MLTCIRPYFKQSFKSFNDEQALASAFNPDSASMHTVIINNTGYPYGMDFLVIQHLDIEPPALIGEVLLEAGHALHALHLDLGDELPPGGNDFSGLIIMGGPQSANDIHLPYIQAELKWLEQRIAEGMPMLGICLGAQLMAKAAGASISASPLRELGWYPILPTEDTASDPLFSSLPEAGLTVFQWHGETFSLPDQSKLVATHPEVPAQTFRLGESQYGLQFHIEVDAPLIEQWIAAGYSERACLGAEGLAELREATQDHLETMRGFCRRMTHNWLALLK